MFSVCGRAWASPEPFLYDTMINQVRATAIDLHMGVVRTPARAIFKNNLNMLFLNINRAIDTTCIHIDTKCNSNRHTSLRNHEIGNDSRIIYKTQR